MSVIQNLNAILGKSGNNLAPNNIGVANQQMGPTTNGNLGGSLDISALTKMLGSLKKSPAPAPVATQTAIPAQTPAPVAAPTPTTQADYNNQAAAAGNMINPLLQYNTNFGQNYANQNMGGYNPMAEYQNLKTEQYMNAARHEGPYAIPQGVPTSMDDIQRINSMGDEYYRNKFARVESEAGPMISNLKNAVTGGTIGRFPKPAQDAIMSTASTILSSDPAKNFTSTQQADLNAQQLAGELKNRTATGADDIRLINLFMGSINPGSSVSEGEYANGASIVGTLPYQVQQSLSKIGAYDEKTGKLSMSKVVNSGMSDEARKSLYDAIHNHNIANYHNYQSYRTSLMNPLKNWIGGDLQDSDIPDIANPNIDYGQGKKVETSGSLTWDNL